MTGQQLKNSILQMAVQGKLVPQDPNDEPASVLLERIRKEKEQLIKEGKIKKEKNPSYIFRGSDNLPYEKVGKNEPVCIADEVPFEIPESWEWVRISSISSIVTKGTTPRGGNTAYVKNGIGFLRAENVNGMDCLDTSNLRFIDEITHRGGLKRSILEENDLLITIAGTLGRTAIVRAEDLPLNANQAISIIRIIGGEKFINLKYLVYAINSPKIQKLLTTQKKITAIPNLTLEIISDCLLPIPPVKEQRRIVMEFDKTLPFINKYNDVNTTLCTLNEHFPDQFKKSILQMAIQGKLVPQDSSDEPASVLLERIRAEKEQLIKAGKIKRDKHESVIFRRDNSHYEKLDGIERCIDDELPFEIPESWEWVRLSTIVTLLSGQDFLPSQYNTNAEGIPYLTGASNIENENVIINRWTSCPRCIAEKNDLLIVCKGAGVGKMAFLPEEIAHIARQLMAIRSSSVNLLYVKLFLEASISSLRESMQGVIPGISRETVLLLLLPLPPLNEQEHIVRRVDEILKAIKTL